MHLLLDDTPTGGSRVAQALRPYLSELGCLPVSKQVIYSNAFQLFDQEGIPREGNTFGMRSGPIKDAVESQCDSLLKELAWFAAACKQQRTLPSKCVAACQYSKNLKAAII